MLMTARQVALLAKDNLFDRLHDLLSTAGWQALRAAEYESTQPLNEHAPVHAGMIQFIDGKKSELSKVESLTAGKNGMAWIALLPPELLLNQSVCRLIKTRFYDFHTLPVDPSRLLSSLGSVAKAAPAKKWWRAQFISLLRAGGRPSWQ
jgi:hypothetical protein